MGSTIVPLKLNWLLRSLKVTNHTGIDQTPAEINKGRGRNIRYQFHKLIDSALQNNRNSWVEFYRYVKRRKWNRVNIPMIKASKGEPITDPVEMANNLNNYYASVFSPKGTFHT